MRDEVVLFHPDARSARQTIMRLSRAGFDGSNVTFLTPVEVTTSGRYSDRQVDRGTARTLVKRGVTGGFIGLALGIVPGMLMLTGFQQASTPVLVAGGAAGGVFGWGIGVLLALQMTPTMMPVWERTFAPLLPGSVPVLVVCETVRHRRRLRRILKRSRLVAVLSYDEYRDITA